jgi:hypothetical protein
VLHDAYIQQVHKVSLGHMKKVKTVYRFYMFIAIHAIKIIRLVQGRSFEKIIIFVNIFFFFQVFHAPQWMHTLIKCSLVLDILDGMNNGTMYLTSSYGNTMNINRIPIINVMCSLQEEMLYMYLVYLSDVKIFVF